MGRLHELLPALRQIPRPARMVYEAGPTGYGLARRARAEGIEVAVCAPGKTDRPPSDRVKTDKRDAIRLARLLAAGELVLVTIPSIEREQLRDLVRCREDIRADLMRVRHRIRKFLLRREIYYEGPAVAWTLKYRSWLTSVRFADQASRATMADYLHARPSGAAAASLVAVTSGRFRRGLVGRSRLASRGFCAPVERQPVERTAGLPGCQRGERLDPCRRGLWLRARCESAARDARVRVGCAYSGRGLAR